MRVVCRKEKNPGKAKMKDVENDIETICCTAKQLKQEENIVGENCIGDNTEKLAFNKKEKKKS